MVRNKYILFCFICFFAGIFAINQFAYAAETQSDFEPLISKRIKNIATAIVEDELTTLHLDKGKVIYTGRKGELILAEKTVAQNVWLESNGSAVYAAWWEKEADGKKLYVRASQDGGKTFYPAVLASKGGVLPQVDFLKGAENNKMALVYVSEEYPGYQVYFNRTLDGGKSWLDEGGLLLNKLYDDENEVVSFEESREKKPDVLVSSTALSPKVSQLGEKMVVVWEERAIRNSVSYLRIVAKVSEDYGLTWSDGEDIYLEPNANPVELNTAILNNEIYIVAFVPNKGVLSFRSKESGTKWESLGVLPGTRQLLSASWLRLASANDQTLLVSYVARANGMKDGVWLNSLSLDSGKWIEDEAKLFGQRVGGGNSFSTKSIYADLKSLGDGRVLIAWEDYRYLMPVVMLSYSEDGGKQWTDPEPLTTPGKTVSKFPSLFAGENMAWVLFTYFGLEDKSESENYLTSYQLLTTEHDIHFPKIEKSKALSEDEMLKKLKMRVEKFWQSRLKGNYIENWGYFDPLYRTLFDKQKWARTQGKIGYLDFEVSDITTHGVLADVTIKVNVTVNQLLMGEDDLIEPPPPKEVTLVGRWGWFYDDWYSMPETMFERRYEY
uniref:Sialidase domain-containing protein n=1 Tax=uncultured Thiotrichaceae bacterium TaxID=298394 RepID=A0A6S6UD95_9GAMM|nr:MAG: Unknown protein [uncultured Thiotrichaceae bacterium]